MSITCAIGLLLAGAVAIQNVPPTATSSTYLGIVTDAPFNPNISRDGGGGGYVNGKHFIAFSDTVIPPEDFVHNSVAYFGDRVSGNPIQLTDFGNFNQPTGQRTFPGPVFGPVTPAEIALGGNFTIWPNSQWIADPDGTDHALAFLQVNNLTSGLGIYSTIARLEVPSPTPSQGVMVLSAERELIQVFNYTGNHQIRFGNGGFFYNGYFQTYYMFGPASATRGMRVASVQLNSLYNQSQYQYYNGSTWTSTMPADNDTSADLYNCPVSAIDTGEVYYNTHFGTLIAIFHCDLSLSFYITYATVNSVIGPWSTPEIFYTVPRNADGAHDTDGCNSGYIYSGHAYPDWDQTGKSVLLSWNSCLNDVNMAIVYFA